MRQIGRLSKWRASRFLDAIAVVLLAGIAAFGAQRWVRMRDARQIQAAMFAAESALGRSVDALVISDEGGVLQPLSDVAAGKCRYIIVGTKTCPYARTAAHRWMTTALNDPAGDRMPEGWQAFWVAAEEITGRGDIFDPAFPSQTFYVRDKIAFILGAGVTHSPLHLVMDRSGVVIDTGSERRLLPMSAFLDDCTIAAVPALPVAEGVTPVSLPGT